MTELADVVPPRENSPFGQLKLNPTIAAICILSSAGINRLEFAETGRDEARRLDALGDQILYHRDCTRRRQIPVRLELPDDRPHVGVAVNAQYPGNLSWNELLSLFFIAIFGLSTLAGDLLECALQSLVVGIRADLFGGFDEPLRLLRIVGFRCWFAGHGVAQ
jgi:hypothetical protein